MNTRNLIAEIEKHRGFSAYEENGKIFGTYRGKTSESYCFDVKSGKFLYNKNGSEIEGIIYAVVEKKEVEEKQTEGVIATFENTTAPNFLGKTAKIISKNGKLSIVVDDAQPKYFFDDKYSLLKYAPRAVGSLSCKDQILEYIKSL